MGKYNSNTIFTGIKGDFPDMIISALEEGIDINIKDAQGFTPLIMAVSLGRNSIVKLLIDKGADVNYEVQGFTPLMIAAQEGLTSIANMLIEANADINAKTADGLTVLMAAARDGHIDVITILLSKDVNVEATTNQGTTALMIADQFKQKAVFELLKKHLGDNNQELSLDLLNRMVVLNVDDK